MPARPGFFSTSNMPDHQHSTGIVIVGVNRGGTSAVAAVLASLDIFMGDVLHAPIYEDLILARLFRANDWRGFRHQVRKYEAHHSLFAWKLPDSIGRLRKVNKQFSSPKYIFVFRDLSAISLRRNESLGTPILRGMIKSTLQYIKALYFVWTAKPDHLLVSYEKLITETEDTAAQILDFLGFEKSNSHISSIKGAVCNSQYREWAAKTKEAERLALAGYQGHFDYSSQTTAVGWLKSTISSDPVTVEVMVNETKVGDVLADQHRKDLVDAGISASGNHGFIFHFPEAISDSSVVYARPKGVGAYLSHSARSRKDPG